MISLIGCYLCFHFSTLEEYYVGTLFLPMFNPVSDGTVYFCLALIITGCVGTDFWAVDVCDGSWL